MATYTVSQQLAGFASEMELNRVPVEVKNHVCMLILDALGVGLAASNEKYSEIAVDTISDIGGNLEATVLGRPQKQSAVWASLVNGIQIHGHDFDDTHSGSVAHTTSVIVPVVLSLGEREGLSGSAVLNSSIVGLEVIGRVGLASQGGFHRKGFHTTAIAGVMGGALAASRCLDLNLENTVYAQGIAGSSAAGLREAYLSGGTWTKMYHPGWAAHSAVMAGLMAEKGFSGTDTVYEGRFGLFKSHLSPQDADYEALLGELGERWEISNIAFKPYPCGVINHSFIDLSLQLRDHHDIKTEDIDSVTVFIHPDAAQTVCEPVETKQNPVSGYHAKFSLHFNIAAALVDGSVDLSTYRDEKVHDSSILDMVGKISHTNDPDSPYPATYPARMEIRMKDGQIFSGEIDHNKGSRKNPMSNDEVKQKFLSNAKPVLGEKRSEKVTEYITNLEKLDDIQDVMDLFR